MAELRFRNVLLSSNPCPKCIEASEADPMTETEWAFSEWGMPGTDGRYCGDSCHCLLVEEGIEVPEPLFGKEKLRGDEDSDIRKVVEIGPKEMGLKDIKEKWMSLYERLPKEIYKMTVDEIGPYLKSLMAQMEA
jgi:hypothetical protein